MIFVIKIDLKEHTIFTKKPTKEAECAYGVFIINSPRSNRVK